jgi:hypothetical protein
MIMAVTDQQVAALRAQLANQPDEHKRLFRQLDWAAEGVPYSALIDAGFFEAVDRRFANGTTTTAAVTAYVGAVRSRLGSAADAVDPEAAERLILKVLGHGSVADLDANVAFSAKQLLLAALIADEDLDDAGLDEFMTSARMMADQWLT